jgi:hypothetical protein
VPDDPQLNVPEDRKAEMPWILSYPRLLRSCTRRIIGASLALSLLLHDVQRWLLSAGEEDPSLDLA